MSKELFTALNDNIIVKKIERDEKATSGGLVLPESVQDDANIATVVAVGPGIRSVTDPNLRGNTPIKPGCTIIIPRFSNKLDWNGNTYYVVRENEIFAIINE